MNINKVMVYGNLTADPELKALPSGLNVTNMTIATNRVWSDQDGKKNEEVQFHNIVVFGKQAENVAKYLTKGSGAFVEGRLQTRSWEKDGQKHYRTEIIAEGVQFGPKKENTTSPAPEKTTESPAVDYPEEEINPEDVPF
jgi:single-strand DNA-binding protein